MENFDYIVVGAGSSGSVITNRLSENNKIKICVIEAGGSNQHPYVKMPAGFIKTINDKRFNWCFKTEGSDYVNNREILFPRGKGYGGSSSINGHLYVRGQPDDYNQWAQLGNLGWSYDDVLPYFKKSEYKSLEKKELVKDKKRIDQNIEKQLFNFGVNTRIFNAILSQGEFEGSSLIDYYRSRGAEPVICNKKRLVSEGYHVLQAPLYSKRITPTLRHDYRRLARAVMYMYKKIKKAS